MVKEYLPLLKDFAKDILEKAGLPAPHMIIGRSFVFGDERHFAIGSITSVGYGADEGVSLYVCVQRFREMNIHRFRLENGFWIARDTTGKQWKDGIFKIL